EVAVEPGEVARPGGILVAILLAGQGVVYRLGQRLLLLRRGPLAVFSPPGSPGLPDDLGILLALVAGRRQAKVEQPVAQPALVEAGAAVHAPAVAEGVAARPSGLVLLAAE